MPNLNKYLAIIFLVLYKMAFAGDVIIFDKPSLVAYSDNFKISGLYSASDGKRSCVFLFFATKSDVNIVDDEKFSSTRIYTFLPGGNGSFKFSDRNGDYDIDGILFRRSDEWIIKTLKTQAGCGNAEGDFAFNPDDIRSTSFYIKSKVQAFGIRMVKAKTFFYDRRAGKYISRKGYLSTRDGVVVLRTHDAYSYVRYSDPGPNANGRVTTGWIRSADLENPYPPISEKPMQ